MNNKKLKAYAGQKRSRQVNIKGANKDSEPITNDDF